MSMNDTTLFSQSHLLAVGVWRCIQVKCRYSSESNSQRTADPSYVRETWDSYQAQYPLAFNGPLLGLVATERCDPKELGLTVKNTNYAEYVATREVDFQNTHPQTERANPIGLTTIVLSSDNTVTVTRRSADADQNPEMPYFVGGYVEPPTDENLDHVICANAAREMEEELGLTSPNVLIVGMGMDPVYCHPELFATTRLPLRSDEIAETWREAPGRDEASELILLPAADFLSHSTESLFPEGTTWSFEAGAFLVKQNWDAIDAMLARP